MPTRQWWICHVKDPRDDWESPGGMAHLDRGERIMSVRPDYESSSYCLADGCRDSAHIGAPVSLCGRHIHEVYSYAKDLIAPRWVDALNAELARRRPDPPIQRWSAEPPSWVYFVRIGDLIKIGYSTNPKERFRALKVDAVLAAIPGTRADEQRYHETFAHLRVRGEYFHPGDDLLTFIRTAA